jgi:hexulose-6-phosphate isomerase
MPPISIHCLQGRLLPPVAGRIQAFPGREWERELSLAPTAGIDGIEWIYEVREEDVNPLRDGPGVQMLRAACARHAVVVESLCADWFFDYPLKTDRAGPERLRQLIGRAAAAGIRRVVVPCVDGSSIDSGTAEDAVVRAVSGSLDAAQAGRVELHLETDLPPERFATLLARLDHELVKANYDTGNSAALGWEATEEWAAYGERIGSVHIKDRLRGGGTVPLGDGCAELDLVFALLREHRWSRPLVLQVARGPMGKEVDWVRAAADQVRRLWAGEVAWA